MRQYFKKVFFSQYQKYSDIVKNATPEEFYLLRAQGAEQLKKTALGDTGHTNSEWVIFTAIINL